MYRVNAGAGSAGLKSSLTECTPFGLLWLLPSLSVSLLPLSCKAVMQQMPEA